MKEVREAKMRIEGWPKIDAGALPIANRSSSSGKDQLSASGATSISISQQQITTKPSPAAFLVLSFFGLPLSK